MVISRWRSLLLMFLALVLAPPAGAAGSSRSAATLVGRVIGVSDGDTLTVLVAGRPIKVRVEGIDCPERGQPFGRVAKSFTSLHAYGRLVELQVHDTDRYGRLVSRVLVGDEDLGLSLLAAGLAWHYTQYSNDADYARTEQAARVRHLGLWSQANPVPPWVARRPGPRAPVPAPRRAPPQAGGPLHGNVKSGAFHAPGCPNYNCKQCTATFASEREALAQGFRPAGDCHSK